MFKWEHDAMNVSCGPPAAKRLKTIGMSNYKLVDTTKLNDRLSALFEYVIFGESLQFFNFTRIFIIII